MPMKTKNLILIGTANELKPVNNVLKIPFGSYDHLQGLQIFGLADATACVEAFNESAKVSGFRGLPIYIGHPDVKAFQDKYRDHAAYGWITAMIANEAEGRLEMTVEWTPPGEALLANEQFAYFSPLWLSVKKAGNVHPFKIKSVGLTQEPNIQFLAIACEEEQPTEGDPMNPLLEKLKLLLPESEREQITTEELLIVALEKMLAVKKEVIPAIAEAANELPGVKATLTETAQQLVVANESLQGIRKTHSALLLDNALLAGKITPATRTKWEERFGATDADFMALANELGSVEPQMKVLSAMKGAKPGDGSDATHADVVAVANELCEIKGCNFEAAYAIAKKDPKFAHLFQVKQADAQ